MSGIHRGGYQDTSLSLVLSEHIHTPIYGLSSVYVPAGESIYHQIYLHDAPYQVTDTENKVFCLQYALEMPVHFSTRRSRSLVSISVAALLQLATRNDALLRRDGPPAMAGYIVCTPLKLKNDGTPLSTNYPWTVVGSS